MKLLLIFAIVGFCHAMEPENGGHIDSGPGAPVITAETSECQDILSQCISLWNSVSEPSLYDMETYYICLQKPLDCSPDEDEWRINKVNEVVAEIRKKCPMCVEDGGVLPTVRLTCYALVDACSKEFNSSYSEPAAVKAFYYCLAKLDNCSHYAETARRQMMEGILRLCTDCPPVDEVLPTLDPNFQSCTNKLMECTSLTNYSSTDTVGLKSAYACLENLDYCKGSEEILRRRSMDNILQMLKYSESCYAQMMECYKGLDENYWMYPNLMQEILDCIHEPQGCTPKDEEIRSNMTQQFLKVCPTCHKPSTSFSPKDPPSSKPDTTTSKQNISCYDFLMDCWATFNKTFKLQNDMEMYLQCIHTPKNCLSWEKGVRQNMTDNIKMYCPTCFTAATTVAPHDMSTSPLPSQSPLSCYDYIKKCERQYLKSTMQLKDMEEYYNCLYKPKDCVLWEENVRRDTARFIEKYCPTCTPPPPPPVNPYTIPGRQKTCYGYLNECWRLHNATQDLMSDRERMFECIHEPTNCNPGEEEFQRLLANGLKKWCPTCEKPTLPVTTPSPPQHMTSCYDFIMNCWGEFNKTNMQQSDMQTFHQCVHTPQDCVLWEEVHRQDMSHDIEKWCHTCPSPVPPTVDPYSLPGRQQTCLGYVLECNRMFNESFRQYPDLLTFYTCLYTAEDCNDEDIYIRELMAKGIEPWCPTCKKPTTPSMLPSSSSPSSQESCGAVINKCWWRFNNSNMAEKDMKTFYNCIYQPTNCQSQDEALRNRIVSGLRGACSGCYFGGPTANTTTEPPSRKSCEKQFEECHGNFEKTSKHPADMEDFYYCVKKPQNCTQMEEMYRDNYIDNIKTNCPSCSFAVTTPTPRTCYGVLSDCWKSFDTSSMVCRDKKELYYCLLSAGGCEEWEENHQKESVEKALDMMKGEGPSCYTDSPETTSWYNDRSTKPWNTDGWTTPWNHDDSSTRMSWYPGGSTSRVWRSCHDHMEMCRKEHEKSSGNLRSLFEYEKCVMEPEGCTPGEEKNRNKVLKTIADAMDSYDPDGWGSSSGTGPKENVYFLVLFFVTIGFLFRG